MNTNTRRLSVYIPLQTWRFGTKSSRRWAFSTGSTPWVGKATQFSLETPFSCPENGENCCCSGSYSLRDTLYHSCTYTPKQASIYTCGQAGGPPCNLTRRECPPPAPRRDPRKTVQNTQLVNTKKEQAVPSCPSLRTALSPPSLVVLFRLHPSAPLARPTLINFREKSQGERWRKKQQGRARPHHQRERKGVGDKAGSTTSPARRESMKSCSNHTPGQPENITH